MRLWSVVVEHPTAGRLTRTYHSVGAAEDRAERMRSIYTSARITIYRSDPVVWSEPGKEWPR